LERAFCFRDSFRIEATEIDLQTVREMKAGSKGGDMQTRRHALSLWIIPILFFGLWVGGAAAGPAGNDIQSLYRADDVFAQEAALVSFGPRVAGSPAELAAAEYIADEMLSFGLEVETQVFDIDYFEELSPPVMERIAPSPIVYAAGIDFATMTYSGAGDVTAVVQAVDLMIPATGGSTSGCEAADFAGFVAGRIALMQRGTCTFAVKAQNAEAAGAVGVVIFNEGNSPDRTGLLLGTLGEPGVAIPVVGTTYAVGEELYSFPPGSVVVHMDLDTISEPRTSQNVIGTLVGTQPAQGIVYIGGHYDSVSAGPGANDDASGVAAVLEAARVLSQKGHRTKATLKFIAFGAEETGLDGSLYYVSEKLDEVSTMGLGMINLDMIAVGDILQIGNIGYGLPGTGGNQLRDYTQQKATAMGMAWESFTAGTNSDHTYFEQAGVPAVFITQRDDPNYHTPNDTLDKIQVDTLEANGELAAAAMYDWAKNPVLRDKKAAKVKKVHVYKDKVHTTE
jgi:aminopeptidase Y